MKYLRKFNESNEDDIIKYIEDIFLQFRDEGTTVDVRKKDTEVTDLYGNRRKITLGDKILGFIVGAGKSHDIATEIRNKRHEVPISHYSGAIHHLLSYMKEEGYRILDFSVVLSTDNPMMKLQIIALYRQFKPTNSAIDADPVGWLESFLEETGRSEQPINKISISFKK